MVINSFPEPEILGAKTLDILNGVFAVFIGRVNIAPANLRQNPEFSGQSFVKHNLRMHFHTMIVSEIRQSFNVKQEKRETNNIRMRLLYGVLY